MPNGSFSEPVRELYEKTRLELSRTAYPDRKPHEMHSDYEPRTRYLIQLWSYAISALAEYDAVKRLGEKRFNKLPLNGKMNAIHPYLKKYDVYRQNER